MGKTRFLIVSDLHGSDIVLNKTVNAAKFYGIRNIVIAGDLTGKLLVPIIKLQGEKYNLNLFGENRTVDGLKLEDVKKQIRGSGYYYKILSEDEYVSMEGDKEKIKAAFLDEMKKGLDEFFTKAHERLRPIGAKLYLIPGNDDYEEVADYIQHYRTETVVPFEQSIVEFDGEYELAGYGYSNPTPWHTPREKPEEQIYEDVKKIMEKSDPKRTILVAHVPPIDTKIDKAPKLTADLKPELVGGEYQMVSVGSTAMRRIIEEYNPLLGLHGHIHESGGIDYVKNGAGKTPVFNPGSDYSAGILRGLILEVDGGKVKNYLFTRG